jgi:hypothetical protein
MVGTQVNIARYEVGENNIRQKERREAEWIKELRTTNKPLNLVKITIPDPRFDKLMQMTLSENDPRSVWRYIHYDKPEVPFDFKTKLIPLKKCDDARVDMEKEDDELSLTASDDELY